MTSDQNAELAKFGRLAEHWWDTSGEMRPLHDINPLRTDFIDRRASLAGKRVLDVGCGAGILSEALARRGAQVTGLDPAEAAIDAARAHAAQEGLGITYEVGAGEDMPYADGSFDAVVCVDVLEHVRDRARVLAETARVLRPGGTFLFDTINRNWIARFGAITMAEDVIGILPRGTHDPEMFITPAELRAGMEEAGLEPGPFTGLGPRGLTRRGDPTFGPLPVQTVQYMGLATKAGG